MDEKHILVSLGDENVKEIGEVIGNKTCNKILDQLIDQELTASEISKKLKLPINTIDYNLKKLIKSGLIEKSSHFWSIKGKKMPTYKTSNRKIIISPKKQISKKMLIAATTLSAITLFAQKIINKTHNLTRGGTLLSNQITEDGAKSLETVMEEAGTFATTPTSNGAGAILSDSIKEPIIQIAPAAKWFILGIWTIVAIYLIMTIWNERRKKK